MNFNRALNKEQTTCINGIFVLFVFLSHFGQYETMPWNGVLLAIGQLMVAPFLFYSGYGMADIISCHLEFIRCKAHIFLFGNSCKNNII